MYNAPHSEHAYKHLAFITPEQKARDLGAVIELTKEWTVAKFPFMKATKDDVAKSMAKFIEFLKMRNYFFEANLDINIIKFRVYQQSPKKLITTVQEEE